jgi:hypothetical protein
VDSDTLEAHGIFDSAGATGYRGKHPRFFPGCSFIYSIEATLMRHILSLLLVLALTSDGRAAIIAFTDQGVGTGTIGNQSFTNTPFTITARANTANRLFDSFGNVFSEDNDSAQITLNGIGTYQFITATRFFVNHNSGVVGFSRAGLDGADLFDGPGTLALQQWAMLTPIGPITGFAQLEWGDPLPVTTGGVLSFNIDGNTQATFSARLVPEPSGGVLAGIAAVLGTFLLSPGGNRLRRIALDERRRVGAMVDTCPKAGRVFRRAQARPILQFNSGGFDAKALTSSSCNLLRAAISAMGRLCFKRINASCV